MTLFVSIRYMVIHPGTVLNVPLAFDVPLLFKTEVVRVRILVGTARIQGKRGHQWV